MSNRESCAGSFHVQSLASNMDTVCDTLFRLRFVDLRLALTCRSAWKYVVVDNACSCTAGVLLLACTSLLLQKL